jgi:hypothetical protein
MTNAYEPTFMAEAYDLLVKSLKDQLAGAQKQAGLASSEQSDKQCHIEKVIFNFVLKHCGYEKLIELGAQIDEMLEKEHGRDGGYVDFLETEYHSRKPRR